LISCIIENVVHKANQSQHLFNAAVINDILRVHFLSGHNTFTVMYFKS